MKPYCIIFYLYRLPQSGILYFKIGTVFTTVFIKHFRKRYSCFSSVHIHDLSDTLACFLFAYISNAFVAVMVKAVSLVSKEKRFKEYTRVDT